MIKRPIVCGSFRKRRLNQPKQRRQAEQEGGDLEDGEHVPAFTVATASDRQSWPAGSCRPDHGAPLSPARKCQAPAPPCAA